MPGTWQMACMLAMLLIIGGCAANSPIAGRGEQAVATKSIVDDELERLRIWHQQHPQQEQPRERAYARIVQIIDNDNALVLLNPGSEYGRQLVWLTGFPTEGLVDDQLLGGHYQDELRDAGTKRYDSSLGAQRTVRLVEYHGVWRKLAGRRDWERKRGTVRCNMFFMVYDALPGGRMVRSDGVRIVGESIHFDAGDYDVPLAEYEDAQDILSWVMHLSDKNWCSLDEITSFIHHVTEMRGISVYR